MNWKKIWKRFCLYSKQFLFMEEDAFERRRKIVRQRIRFNRALDMDFKCRVIQIKERKSEELLRKYYIPKVIQETLEVDGYLIGEHQAFDTAVKRMMIDVTSGKVDEFYNLIEGENNVEK